MTLPSNVIGTDGIAPILDDAARVSFYALPDLYMGKEGKGKYVGKKGDIIIDGDSGGIWKVISVDDMLIPTLIQTYHPVTPVITETDIMIGNGPGTPAETYRIYVDKSVKPYRLTVDAALSIPGTKARTCIVYRGAIIGGVGTEAISQVYDASNTLVGNVIPLELAAMNEMTNYSVRTVPTCYTTMDLVDNEIVTAVFYSDDGAYVSKRQLVVVNSQFINKPEASKRYILGVTLESSFLSAADPHLLMIPMGAVLGSANLFGRIHYSNGDTLRLPVDGVKFEMIGMGNFVATQISQKIPVTLQYNLSSDEASYNAKSVGNHSFVQERYQLMTVKPDGKYSLKLYGYPVWVDAAVGYRMTWHVMDLARTIRADVTPYVTFNDNSAGWMGTAYGVVQQLSVSIDMYNVSGAYGHYVHTQAIDVMLNRPGTDHTGTSWTVAFTNNQNPRYGRDNACRMHYINQNLKTLNISQGLKSSNAGDFATWLDRLYYQTLPLYDPVSEIRAPEPNGFALRINGTRYDYTIDNWDKDLTHSELINDSSTIYVIFYKQTAADFLYLSVAGLPVYQQT